MENDQQLKVGLIIALVFALFFACMLGYFIAVKNLWMCIAMGAWSFRAAPESFNCA